MACGQGNEENDYGVTSLTTSDPGMALSKSPRMARPRNGAVSPSRRLADRLASARRHGGLALALILSILLLDPQPSRPRAAGAGVRPAGEPKPPSVRAGGDGFPWFHFHGAADLPMRFPQVADAWTSRVLKFGALEPLSLASGDFNEDGKADLVSGYSTAGGGLVVVQLGSPSTSPEAAAGPDESVSPFVAEALPLALPAAPHFLAAGDFNADGHEDLLFAERGDNVLRWLAGNGRGVSTATAVQQVFLPGRITSLSLDDVNRADGLADVLVGISRGGGFELLVLEGPAGALAPKMPSSRAAASELAAAPESFPLAAEAVSIAAGRLDGDALTDIAVASGEELLVVFGRDRRLSWNHDARSRVKPAETLRLPFPSRIQSLATGDFRGDSAEELALLLEDGSVAMWSQQEKDSGAAIKEWALAWSLPVQEPPRRPASESPRLVATRASSLARDSLLVMGSPDGALRVIVEDENPELLSGGPLAEKRPGQLRTETLYLDGPPAAVLSMRLNGDALADLVILKNGDSPIALVETAPGAIITVNSNGDTSARDSVVTLREAMDIADGRLALTTLTAAERAQVSGTPVNPGLDEIRFSVTSITLGSGGFPSPRVSPSNPITINGTSAGRVEIKQAGNASVQISNSVGNSTVRNLAVGSIRLLTGGSNVVAGNFVGMDLAGTLFTAFGSTSGISAETGSTNNIIGGTAAADRNVVAVPRTSQHGILISRADGNRVAGNYIGTSIGGDRALGNQLGVHIEDSRNTIIGGTEPRAGNVISGNGSRGIEVVRVSGPDPDGTRIQGNLIGVAAGGASAVGNQGSGISLFAGNDATIGGTSTAARNVISGNRTVGIEVGSTLGDVTGTQIQGNYIGTDSTGLRAVGNGTAGGFTFIEGVHLDATRVLVGGVTSNARNVISGNQGAGIVITTRGGGQILGNYVGISASGSSAVGNQFEGILVSQSADNIIGGSETGAGNVVSGNGRSGILVGGSESKGTRIQGNLIGTDGTGSRRVGNATSLRGGTAGVVLLSADNIVGGANTGEFNVISGNETDGVLLGGSTAVGNRIQGNRIGTDAAGRSALPNASSGIKSETSAANAVGGTAAGAGNVIAFNAGEGIWDAFPPGISILGNSIHSNGRLGIDVGSNSADTAGNGVTTNDAGDVDGVQNFPTLSLPAGGSNLEVALSSRTANGPFRIEVFSNTTCDASGNGEGDRAVLALENVVLDAAGRFSTAVSRPTGAFFTATATDAKGNTSEFSLCAAEAQPTPLVVNSTGDAADRDSADGRCDTGGLLSPGVPECTLRAALQQANASPGVDAVRFGIAGSGPYLIQPHTDLPVITDPVAVDGTSQTGYSGRPLIRLDGSLSAGFYGLVVSAGGSTFRGLTVTGFRLSGIDIRDRGGNRVTGNFFGTESETPAAGQNPALGNGYGISITSGGNLIGGTTQAERNVVAASEYIGIYVLGREITGNILRGNFIAGNRRGIVIQAPGTQVGGVDPASGNIVTANIQEGIAVGLDGSDSAARGNSILSNQIYDNAGLGIDLGQDGVTLPDPGDADAGPNGLQNQPEILSATSSDTGAKIRLRLRSTGREAFTIQCFSDGKADISGYGEGRTLLGSRSVTASDSGYASAVIVSGTRVGPGGFATCTATQEREGHTSEFSKAVAVEQDSDDDGVSDDVEDGDSNRNGIPDRNEASVASVPLFPGGRFGAALSRGRIDSLGSAGWIGDPAQFARELTDIAGADRRAIALGMQVAITRLLFDKAPAGGDRAAGTPVTVTLFLPPGLQVAGYLNYGPTPDNREAHFYSFSYDGTTGAEIGAGRITLHYVDGERGDHDLEVNGAITTMGGPVLSAPLALYFPYYREDPATFAGFALSNLSGGDALVQFSALGANGQPLLGDTNPQIQVLAKANQSAVIGSQFLGINPIHGQSGWVEILGTRAEVASFFQTGASDLGRLDGSVAFTQQSRRLYFTRAFQGTGAFRGQPASTLLSIANPNARPVTLKLSLFGSAGQAPAGGILANALLAPVQTRTIAARGVLSQTIAQIFGPAVAVAAGYVEGEVIDGAGAVGFELIELTAAGTVIGLNASTGNSARESYSAQLAHVPGALFTGVKLVNVSGQQRRITLRAIGEDGHDLASPVNRILDAGHMLEEEIHTLFSLGSSAGLVGSLRVESDGSGVIGDVIFGDPAALRYAAGMPLQSEALRRAVFSQVANTPPFYTGLALYNPGTAPAEVVVDVFTSQGNLTGQARLTVRAGERISRLIPQLVSASGNQAGGYVVVQSSVPLIAQQLFGDSGGNFLSAVPPTILAGASP